MKDLIFLPVLLLLSILGSARSEWSEVKNINNLQRQQQQRQKEQDGGLNTKPRRQRRRTNQRLPTASVSKNVQTLQQLKGDRNLGYIPIPRKNTKSKTKEQR